MSRSLEDLQNQLNNWSDKIKKAAIQGADDLAEIGLKQIQNNYSLNPYKPNSDVDFFKIGSETEKKVGVSGEQVLYQEFGTGTVGERHPHDNKSSDLKGYNTGPTIRKSGRWVAKNKGIPLGEKYWTYRDENGQWVYTQGVPAGKEVYYAAKNIRENKNEIILKRIREAIK